MRTCSGSDAGLAAAEVAAGLLDSLAIDTAMSHLACADKDHAANAGQRARFIAAATGIGARRLSLANSAGIALGPDYVFDLTRPGLALYGGVPCAALAGAIACVVTPQAQVVQRRRIAAGEGVGYNAMWHAARPTEAAVVNIGYADGYARGFSNRGAAWFGGAVLPVIGRVSMDLLTLDVSAAPALAEGDWVFIDFDLPAAAAASELSQYELLTGLGQRFDRVWT